MLLKFSLFFFLTFSAENKASTFATTIAQPTVIPTSPSTVISTARPTVIPIQKCATETTMNIYLNYFFDTGNSHQLFDLYHNIIQFSSTHPTLGNPKRWLSIFAANAQGSTPPATPLSDLQALQSELFPLFNPPYYTSTTSNVIQDLSYYEAVLPAQLTYPATPVVVIFLKNPLINVNASVAKMNELKNANPTTYFFGVLLSTEPSISKLPFDFTLNLTVADSTAAQNTVNKIMNFICTATPPNF